MIKYIKALAEKENMCYYNLYEMIFERRCGG